MEWQWEEGSVLYKTSPYVAPGDIFQAVCREIGRYFETKPGFKATKRKITWTGQLLCCGMTFWSSHSNMRGEYVCLEILTGVYAKDRKDLPAKGGLPMDIRGKIFNVCHIDTARFFEIIAYIETQLEYIQSLDSKENFLHFVENRIPPTFKYNGEENFELVAKRLRDE